MDALLEFGPAAPSMGGPVPVSFTEIEAWARITQTELPGYEAVVLRDLSRIYCNQLIVSKDPQSPMPLMPGENQKAQVAAAFVDMCRQMKAQQK